MWRPPSLPPDIHAGGLPPFLLELLATDLLLQCRGWPSPSPAGLLALVLSHRDCTTTSYSLPWRSSPASATAAPATAHPRPRSRFGVDLGVEPCAASSSASSSRWRCVRPRHLWRPLLQRSTLLDSSGAGLRQRQPRPPCAPPSALPRLLHQHNLPRRGAVDSALDGGGHGSSAPNLPPRAGKSEPLDSQPWWRSSTRLGADDPTQEVLSVELPATVASVDVP
jgi:hypothetical protein